MISVNYILFLILDTFSQNKQNGQRFSQLKK